MSTIIVGVDLSDSSTRAVELATRIARSLDLPLIIVHVIPWSPYSFQTQAENDYRPRERKAEIAAAEEQVIEPMVALTKDLEKPVETLVRHGKPSDLLIDIAEERKAAHLIVGRTGDSGLKVSLFGSVASRLVQHAPVPVTVVP
ncbi:MAG: universal stress protein [Microlunatus sp.]|nr:universal stress protein [Microlunatus sp.]